MNEIKLLRLAYQFGHKHSDDPVTHNGSLIIRDNDIIAFGTNHFPAGTRVTAERLERPLKYAWMEHAERDVILAAARNGRGTARTTMVCPWSACADCARAIVGAGIRTLIGHQRIRDMTPERWMESVRLGDEIMREGGVEIILIPDEIGGCETLFNGEIWQP